MQINPQTAQVQLNSRDPHFYQDPYPTYARLQEEAPVFYWEEHQRWCFVRHADVTGILRDRRFGRQITHILSREELGWPPEREDLKPFLDIDRVSLLDLEPPDHTRLRSLIQKAFMARQIAQLEPRIAALAHQLIDEMPAQKQTDLLPAFATPIPVTVIAEFLGVPTSLNQQLLDWSHAMVKMYELARTAEMEQQAVQAAVEFVAFLKEFIAHKRRNPGDDLISNLIRVEERGERLAENEMITTCILLLNAGHEATVNVIGNGVLALLKHPVQLARWRREPGLAKTAVEELLRYDTPLHLFNRYVLEDLEWNGLPLKQGEQVSLILGAANRDRRAFTNPQQLQLDRRVNPHVSFGGGIHYCIGAPLARLELQTALPILLQRLPQLALAAEPRFADSYHFHGLEALPVQWG
jgi:cytochrome P450